MNSGVSYDFGIKGDYFPKQNKAAELSSRQAVSRHCSRNEVNIIQFDASLPRYLISEDRGRSVGTVTGQRVQPSRFDSRWGHTSFFYHPEWLWDPSSLLTICTRGLCRRRLSSCNVKLTTHLHLIPNTFWISIHLHSLQVFNGLWLNEVQRQTERRVISCCLILYTQTHKNNGV
jgi:hypothetical protein